MKTKTIQTFSIALALLYPWSGSSNPTDPVVMTGWASVQNSDASTLLVQSSDGTILHWNSFSIDAAEETRFILPSASAAILNRVTGALPSSIAGVLSSNGRVYLINPNGVLVTPSGIIDTASFIASTLDVLDADFLSGKDLVWTGESLGTIVNLGTIHAREGDLFLISRQVDNQGTLSAEKGTVGLGAGSEVLLSMGNDQRLFIRPKRKTDPTDVGILESGFIEAMQAEIRADGSSYAQGIRHSGHVQALGVEERGGRIFLVAEEGEVSSSGTMIAQNKGEVHVLGRGVALTGEASIEAHGGTVLIGGDYQGSNTQIPNSDATFVGENVRIDVSAGENGDGGRAILWSDGGCQFLGFIDARGGAFSGDGGFVEVSGKRYLDFHGLADTRAPFGHTGTLLLDPTNIIITAAATAGDYLYNPASGTFQYLSTIDIDTAGVITNLQNTDITTQLGLTNVVIQSVTDAIQTTTTAALGLSAGDIMVIDGVNIVDPAASIIDNHLTLNAAHTIYFHGQMVTTMSGNGDVNLIAGADIILGPYSETAASTAQPQISLTGSTVGYTNISLEAGNNVTITNNFAATGGLATTTGSISVTALDGDVTMKTGFVAGSSVEMNAVERVSITANNGEVLLLGGAPTAASTVTVLGSTEVDIRATLGLKAIGGNTASTPVTISSSGNIFITTAEGDLLFQAGTADTTGVTVSAGGGTSQIALNASNGSIYLVGGVAGGSTNSPVSIDTGSIVSFTAGRDCYITGGVASGSPSLILANLGLEGRVGGDLYMHGGYASGSYVQIGNVFNTLNLTIGNNLSLIAGNDTNTFAQIGFDFTGIGMQTTSDISITQVGGNVQLQGTPVMGISNAYAVIGHGSPVNAGLIIAGDITFSSGVGGDLILTGGPSANSNQFAQIGHFGGTLAPTSITGNIRINEVGNNIVLDPGSDYALIGHGTNNSTTTTITGDVYVHSSIGSVFLNATLPTMATDIFTQIGHIGSTNAVGDVVVELGGSLKMRTSDSVNSSCVIGHGNFNTPTGASFLGSIRVAAGSLDMTAGDAAAMAMGDISPHCLIGFYKGGASVRGDISVDIQGDISLQGGGPTSGAGNALIGFSNLDEMAGPSASFTGITVRSFNGNITLTGGAGSIAAGGPTGNAYIGLLSGTGIAPTLFESPVRVECLNGTLSLTALPADTMTYNLGTAAISNRFPFSSPYDVTVRAGDIILNGAGSPMGPLSGLAMIASVRNLSIETSGNLQIIPSFGQALIQMTPVTSELVMNIGGDLIIEGGLSTFSGSINIPMTGVNQTATLSANIGHDLILRANTTSAFIGPDSVTGMTMMNQEIAMDFSIGHDLLMFGSSSMGASAYIGAFPMAMMYQNAAMHFDVGGNVFLQSGNSGGTSDVLIGPTIMGSSQQLVDLSFKVGGDVNLLLDSGVSNDVVIGAATMMSPLQTLNIALDIGGSMTMTGGSASSSFCQVGPTFMSSSFQNFSLSAGIGRDLTLVGGTNTSCHVHMGPIGATASNSTTAISIATGGDLTLLAGGAMDCPVSIGTDPSSGFGFGGTSSVFNVDCHAGGDFILVGGAVSGSSAYIGPSSITGTLLSSGTRVHADGNGSLRGGSDMSVMTAIAAPAISATNTSTSVAVSTGGDLTLSAGNNSSNVLIGGATMAAATETLTVSVNAGQSLIMDGSLGASTCQIGPLSNTANNQTVVIDAATGQDLAMIGGAGVTAIGLSSFVGTMTPSEQIGTIALNVGGKMDLLGSSAGGTTYIGMVDLGPMTGYNSLSIDAVVADSLFMHGQTGPLYIGVNTMSSSATDSNLSISMTLGNDLQMIADGPTTSIGVASLVGGGMAGASQNLEISIRGGRNFSMETSSGFAGFAFIGTSTMTGSNQNVSLSLDFDGHGTMKSNGFFTMIGPFAMPMMGNNRTVDIGLTFGGDFLMQLGSAGGTYNAGIAVPVTMDGLNDILQTRLTTGGSVLLYGGSSMTGICQIGPQTMSATNQSFTFDGIIGGDLRLIGSSGASVAVLIGPTQMTGSAQSCSVNVRTGGNLEVLGGSGTSCPAAIGTSPAAAALGFAALSQSSLLVNCRAEGDFLVQGGTGMSSSAQIGPSFIGATMAPLSTTRLSAGGNGVIAGGGMGGGSSIGIVGPSSITSTLSDTFVEVSTGHDLFLMTGGSMSNSALIGAPAMTSTVTRLFVSVSAGDGLTLDGGFAPSAACQIGPLSNTATFQTVDINVSAGKDLALIASPTMGTPTVIGLTSFTAMAGGAPTNQLATIVVDAKGSITIQESTSSPAYIGLDTFGSGGASQDNLVSIAVTAGSSLIFEGTGMGGMGTACYIGADTFAGPSSALQISLDAGHDFQMVRGGGGFYVGTTTMSDANQNLQIDIHAGRDIYIEGPSSSAGGVASYIGPLSMPGTGMQTAAVRLDCGGNATLLGSTNGMTNSVYIGPVSSGVATTQRTMDVSLSTGGDFLMQAGNGTNNSVFFAAPVFLLGVSDLLTATLDIGGGATLSGGSTTSGFCQIGPQVMGGSTETFILDMSVGRHLSLIGSTSASTSVLVGPGSIFGTSDIARLNLNIGGDLTLQGGTAMSATSAIGTSPLGMGLFSDNNLLAIDIVARGGMLLQGGSGMTALAAIGPLSLTDTGQISTTQITIGGDATLLGGSGAGAHALIGPQSLISTQEDATVSLTVGHDLLMNVGVGGGASTFIGSPTMTNTNETLVINVEVGHNMIMDGTFTGAGTCLVGPLSNTMNSQTIDIHVGIGGDLLMMGGMGAMSPTAIGAVTFSGGMAGAAEVATIALDVGGNVTLQSTLGALTYIGIDSFGGGASNILTLDMKVGDSILMPGSFGNRVFIGANTMSGANNVLTETLSIGHDLRMIRGASGMFIGTTDMSASEQNADISLAIGRDLLIMAPQAGVLGNFIGARSMSSNFQNAVVTLDIGGSATLLGTDSAAGNVFIGPNTMASQTQVATVAMTVGADLLLQAGTSPSTHAIFIASPAMTGSSEEMRLDLSVGGSIDLIAGFGGIGNSVAIASPAMSMANQQMLLNLSAGGDIEMNGGATMAGICQIGPQTITGSQALLQMNITAGGNLSLLGSSGTTTSTQIGVGTMLSGGGIAAINLDLGGDLFMEGGSGNSSFVQIGHMGANSVDRTTIDLARARNVTVSGGSGLGAYSLIGMGPAGGVSPFSDIHLGQISGNLTVGQANLGGLVAGIGSFAQIGHVGAAGAASTLTGDITIDRIGGTLTLRAPSSMNASAVIGHDNPSSDLMNTVSGRISIHAGSAQILAGAAAGATAVIGFNPPSGAFTLTSPLVELICERDISVTANAPANAFIGYYDTAALGTNATISMINVEAERGNIALTGSTGSAVIGTQTGGGISQSSIKVTADRDLILTSTGSGGAQIVNNRPGVAAPTYHVSIDPESVILLSGTSGAAMTILSSGNLTLNFDDALNLNFDTTLQSGSATVVANNDLFMNTSTPSYGTINLQGSSGGGLTAITTTSGSIFIGSPSTPGGGDIHVGYAVAATGGCNITSGSALAIHSGGTISLLAGTMMGSNSVISSVGNQQLKADNSITLLGNGNSATQITSSSGSVDLIAKDTLSVGLNSSITTTTLGSHIFIDPIAIVVLSGTISSAGNLTLLFDDRLDINYDAAGGVIQAVAASVDAVGDIFINQTPVSYGVINIQGGTGAVTSQLLSSGGSIFIGTATTPGAGDVNVGVSAVTATGAASIQSATETQINAAGNIAVQGNGPSQITSSGNVSLTSGNNISAAGTAAGTASVSSTAGSLFMTAGASISGGASATYTAPGSLEFDAGLDVSTSANATVSSTGSGDVDATAGRDISMLSAVAVSSASGDYRAEAGRDINQTSAATFPGGAIGMNAGRSININGAVSNGTDAIVMNANQDVNLSGGSVVTSGSARIQAARNVNEAIAVSVSGTGNLALIAGQYVNVSGALSLLSTGTMSLTAGEDVNVTGSLTSSAAGFSGGDIQMSAVRDINFAGGSATTNGSHIIYGIAGNNVNLTNASISQSSIGPIELIAGRDMTLTNTAISSPSRGFVTLVVDNLFPDSAKYGRGTLNIDNMSTVSNGGGELRFFTARQPFNTISGLLNGVPFAPSATPGIDTTTETWLSYYYRSLVGVDYMVFYKDEGTSPIPPVPPSPPAPPPSPSPSPSPSTLIPFSDINLFWTAISEAIRNWEVYDEFLFGEASFDEIVKCPALAGGGVSLSDNEVTSSSSASSCSAGKTTFHLLRQGYRNYHTKKLDTRY